MHIQPPIPVLRSFDFEKAKAFYLDYLGFRLLFEHKFNDEAPLYIGITLGQCVLHLTGHHSDACPGSLVRIAVEDVEGFCRSLSLKSYRYANPSVIEQPWGYKELVVSDPSGNRLVFCTPIPQSI